MRSGIFLVTAAAVSAFLPLSTAQAREAFTAVLSANGQSRTYGYNSIEDAIDSVSGTSLKSLLPSYREDAPATASFNLRGLAATIEYPTSGSAIVLKVPSAGIERTFTGATRDEAQDAVTEYFKGAGGTDVTKVLQAAVRETAIDPVAGNPDSLMSLMGAADFAQGTDALSRIGGDGSPNLLGFSVEAGRGTASGGYDQNRVSGTFSYRLDIRASRHPPSAVFASARAAAGALFSTAGS